MSDRQLFYLRALLLLGGLFFMLLGSVRGSIVFGILGGIFFLIAVFAGWIWWFRKLTK